MPDRREFLRLAALSAAALALPLPLGAQAEESPGDQARLRAWLATLRRDHLASAAADLGRAAVGVGRLALGPPYLGETLDASPARPGASPFREPLTARLDVFDCVTLVESSLAVA